MKFNIGTDGHARLRVKELIKSSTICTELYIYVERNDPNTFSYNDLIKFIGELRTTYKDTLQYFNTEEIKIDFWDFIPKPVEAIYISLAPLNFTDGFKSAIDLIILKLKKWLTLPSFLEIFNSIHSSINTNYKEEQSYYEVSNYILDSMYKILTNEEKLLLMANIQL